MACYNAHQRRNSSLKMGPVHVHHVKPRQTMQGKSNIGMIMGNDIVTSSSVVQITVIHVIFVSRGQKWTLLLSPGLAMYISRRYE